MTVWHWVRHGPTHAKAMVGWTDLPADLSDTAALARLSNALPTDALVVSSDLIRASQTADAIQGNRARLDHRHGLREMNFGAWENLSSLSIPEADSERARAFWENPGEVGPPDGECWNDFSRRVHDEIERLESELPDTPIVAVAHFGVVLAALQLASGMAARNLFSFKIDNLSVTRIERLNGGRWRVLGVNHLP